MSENGRGITNLRWITPVLLTFNLAILSWIVSDLREIRIDGRQYTDKVMESHLQVMQPIIEEFVQRRQTMTDMASDIKVIKNIIEREVEKSGKVVR